jgi:TolB-like protein
MGLLLAVFFCVLRSGFPELQAREQKSFEKRELIAALEIQSFSKRVSTDDAQYLSDAVRKVLSDATDPDKYVVMTRENMDLLISPEERRCLNEACYAVVAKRLQAKILIAGNVRDIEDQIGITLEAYEGATGAVLGIEQGEGRNLSEILKALREMAPRLVAKVLKTPLPNRAQPEPKTPVLLPRPEVPSTGDVLYLKDGSIVAGTITYVWKGKVKIVDRAGRTYEFDMNQLDRAETEGRKPTVVEAKTLSRRWHKSAVTAWALSFLPGFGAGHFYVKSAFIGAECMAFEVTGVVFTFLFAGEMRLLGIIPWATGWVLDWSTAIFAARTYNQWVDYQVYQLYGLPTPKPPQGSFQFPFHKGNEPPW